jgi:hypothetical protein
MFAWPGGDDRALAGSVRGGGPAAFDGYYNSSASPVEIESVSLIDSHDLVLHGAVVYEMRHSEDPLIQVDGWG